MGLQSTLILDSSHSLSTLSLSLSALSLMNTLPLRLNQTPRPPPSDAMDTVVPETPPDWVDYDASCRRSVVHGVPPFIGDDGAEGATPPDLVLYGSETEALSEGFYGSETLDPSPFEVGSETESPVKGFDGSETQPPSEGFYVPDSLSPSPLPSGSETEDPGKGLDGSETQAPFAPFDGSWTNLPSRSVNLLESESPCLGLDDIEEGAMQPAVEPNREYTDNEKAMLLIMFPCMKDIF